MESGNLDCSIKAIKGELVTVENKIMCLKSMIELLIEQKQKLNTEVVGRNGNTVNVQVQENSAE